MVHRIERRYEEQLIHILKECVSEHSSLVCDQVKTDVAHILEMDGEVMPGKTGYAPIDILPGLFVGADVRLLPNGEPETIKDREVAKYRLVFEKFLVLGHWKFFLALCLQEKELVYGPTFYNNCPGCVDGRECQYHMISKSCFKNRYAPDFPDISAWVQYIERKYNIYAPPVHGYERISISEESDERPVYLSLLNFLTDNNLEITGGIIFDKCLP